MNSQLTHDDLVKIISYDPATGVLTWKVSIGLGRPGKAVGSLSRYGYVKTQISGVYYMAHRVAWLHFYGEWPPGMIDHINGKRSDNRIENLRLATYQQNAWNTAPRNASGVKGVTWNKQCRKWQVGMRCKGVNHHVGLFDDLDSAKSAALAKQAELHGEFARLA